MTGIDLDSYFKRIGFVEEPRISVDTLAAIQLAHTQSIPFENLDPFLGVSVDLEAGALWTKMVERKRGGYCFEQNTLLSYVLLALGFNVSGLAARVLWHASAPETAPGTHMLLRVDIGDRTYIVDTGFGGQVLTGPLALAPGVVQSTPHELFRLMQDNRGYILQSFVRNRWEPLYGFDLSKRVPADYGILNYYLSTAANSPFVNGLMIARPGSFRRHTLSSSAFREKQFADNDDENGIATLGEHDMSGKTNRHVIRSVRELIQVLDATFGIVLEDEARIEERFAQPDLRRAG